MFHTITYDADDNVKAVSTYNVLPEQLEVGEYVATEEQRNSPLAWVPANGELVSRPSTDVALVEAARAVKISSINDAYLLARFADVAYMGTTFQADAESVVLLNGAVANYTVVGATPDGFFWKDAANNHVPMTLAQLQGLGQAVAEQVWVAFQRWQDRKAAVAAATTTEEVEAIVW